MASKIEWTEETWNPFVGCTPVSKGCDNCYAGREASGRLKNLPLYQGIAENGVFNGTVRLAPERLTQPLRWTRPRKVFVNSMSDLFHEGVPDAYIATIYAVMASTPQHTYQILTKRHGRMRALLRDECRCHAAGTHFKSAMEWAATPHNPDYVPGLKSGLFHRMIWPLPNVHLGVSVEDQRAAELRIGALIDTPAAVRWVSAEPLLGGVNLQKWLGSVAYPNTARGHGIGGQTISFGPGIDWVVAGGESGPNARPSHPGWFRSLREQCEIAGVPFLFKQHGEWVDPDMIDTAGMDDVAWNENGLTIWPDGRTSAGVGGTATDGSTTLWRVGKKRAGRVLDGRLHDGYPQAVAA